MRRNRRTQGGPEGTGPVELDSRTVMRGILLIIALAAILLVCIRYALL
ncbi:MAG TPA: hypothetical protein VEO56_10690 [Bacteroidota bacterium]|nr:hypothetical protein [Bacteroidota bacterium]